MPEADPEDDRLPRVPAEHAVAAYRQAEDRGAPPAQHTPAEVTVPQLTDPLVVGRIHRGWKHLLPATNLGTHAGLAADAGELGPCWFAAASVAGPRHSHRAEHRQDAYSYAQTADRRLAVVALADGVSTQPNSTVGARIAVNEAVRRVIGWSRQFDDAPEVRLPSQPELLGALLGVSSYVREAAILQEVNPVTYACTLLVAVVVRDDPQVPQAVLASVGDSAFIESKGGRFDSVLPLIESDGPLVDFVPFKRAEQVRFAEITLAPDALLILASDGVVVDLRQSPEVRTWLASQWSGRVSALAAANALSYQRQGSHDDRTAILLAPLHS